MISFLDEEQSLHTYCDKYYIFIADTVVQVVSGDVLENSINQEIGPALARDISEIAANVSDVIPGMEATLSLGDIISILETVKVVHKSTFNVDDFYTNMLRDKVISLFADFI